MKTKIHLLIICLLLTTFTYAQNFSENSTNIRENSSLMTNIKDNSSLLDIPKYYEKQPLEIYKLKINSKEILKEGISNSLKEELSNLEGEKHVIIQFYNSLSKLDFEKLKKREINILDYLGGNAYYVNVKPKTKDYFVQEDIGNIYENLEYNPKLNQLLNINKIRAVSDIDSNSKLSVNLKDKNFPPHTLNENGELVVIIKYYSDVDKINLFKKLKQDSVIIISELEIINSLIVFIPLDNFEIVKEFDEIEFIQERYPFIGNSLSITNEQINVDYIQDIYNLNGNGIKIFEYEYEGLPYKNHSDLYGRVFWTNNNSNLIDNHATEVAGILIGNGTIDSFYIGVAPKSTLWAESMDSGNYDEEGDIISEYIYAIDTRGTNLATNSWNVILKDNLILANRWYLCPFYGDYESMAFFYDKAISGVNFSYSTVPVVFSVGNEREGLNNPCTTTYNPNYPYNTTTTPATAKNVISVGNIFYNNSISSTSSYGPTDDDRIKPELVAPGCVYSTNTSNGYSFNCGTSFSAPHVSGTIALMLEQWNKSGYQTTLGDPLPSTIKALLLDSTVDLSRTGNGTQMIDGPDYVNGFGLLDAKGAVDRIINGTFIESNISEEYDLDVYAINITYQDTLKVTLAWDDIPNHNLVNDLDLYLLSPSGTKYYPWTLDPINPSDPAIQTEADHDNVVEQVYISEDEIEEGQWLIVVSSTECATTNCPQKYSLVSEYSISQYVPLSEDTDLYAYYTFNADTKDSTAYYNDATNYDATLTSSGCHDGSCYLFDGVNDYIDLNTNFDNTASEITFSGWFNLAETPSINAPYFDCVYDGNHEFSRLEYIPNQNGLRANWRTSDGNSQLASSYLTQDVNTWHHLVFVKNITSNKFTLYLDGIPKYSVTDEGNGDFNYLDRNCLLGKYHGSTGYWFEGKIDEISLWNRALSDLEIERLYSSGILIANYSSNSSNTTNPIIADSNLHAHYTFDTNTSDSSENNNDATNYGATLTSSDCHDGSCYSFDGSNDYIDLGTNFANTASEITFSGWYYPTNSPLVNAPYFDCVYDGSHEFSRLEYIPSQSGLRANWRTSDGNSQLASSYLTLSQNTWHHIAFVKNITSNKFNIYLDGEIEYSVTDNGNGDFNYNNRNCLLGKYHGSTGYWFEGKIDDLSLWDRAFSTEEIQRLYNYGISYE